MTSSGASASSISDYNQRGPGPAVATTRSDVYGAAFGFDINWFMNNTTSASMPMPGWALACRIVLPFALGYLLSYLFRAVNALIAPNLITDLGLDASVLGLLSAVYFLTFAAFQLPLGVLLDRYGPRRTESVLLIIATAGAIVFALAESQNGLILGRALIGLGVSACLMASFKAFAMWFPKERLPTVIGIQMTAGGIGILAASTPVEYALGFTDWRGVFFILAAVTALAAAILFLVSPEKPSDARPATLSQSMDGVRRIYKSPVFWRIAPLSFTSQAAFMAVHTLWAGPWLRDIAHLDRPTIANYLAAMGISLIIAWPLTGWLADRLGRHGIKTEVTGAIGMGIFAVVQIILLFEPVRYALPVWVAFNFFAAFSVLSYAGFTQKVPPELAGRANTALNVLVFGSAFICQWGVGVIIDLWPTAADGGFHPDGYKTAFAVLVVLQILALLWFWRSPGRHVDF